MAEKEKFFNKKNLLRILMFVVTVALIAYFTPDRDQSDFYYKINKPWAYQKLMAPFDMPEMLDSATIKAKKDSIDRIFVPIFKVRHDLEKSMAGRIECADSVSAGLRHKAVALLKERFEAGIVDKDVYDKIKAGELKQIRILENNVMRTVATDGMVSVRYAYEIIDSGLLHNPAVSKLRLAEIIQPNVVKDTVTSDRYLNDLYRYATAPIGIIQKGERIVDKGDIITPKIAVQIQTYQSMMKARKQISRDAYFPIAGYTLIVAVLMGLLFVFLSLYRQRILNDNRKLLFLLSLIVWFTLFSFFVINYFHNGIYFIPLTLIPIVLVTFFDSRTAFFVTVIQILLCSPITEYSLEFILLHIIASTVAINSLRELSSRSQLIRTAIFVFFAYSVTYVAANVMLEGNFSGIVPRTFLFFGINAVLLSFAYILIFVFERCFGFVSKVTLVELADINNPLLRELSEKCPGTFQHSLQVSNLVSDAAREIGANTQLARAGALYHDIGKMENPAFFTENQHDVNPHELLTPEQSAKIVIQHVTDGLKRADKAKLPGMIKDFIAQHHGRSLTRYFYTVACNNNGGQPVDPAPYTYPGPNPRTKETSLLMMADATEAASRSLKEYNDEAISVLVNKIVDGQIAQGLMKDSPLSFRDVETVKKVFISRLRTMYHTRVSYPELIKKDKDGGGSVDDAGTSRPDDAPKAAETSGEAK